MKLTFIGTSSATPTRRRNVSALALQFVQSGAWWLFDCGEATQHRIQSTPLKLGRMERIFITHLHGDHIFGLPGLMASRSLQDGAATSVAIAGPAGLDEYLRTTVRVTGMHLGYPWAVETLPRHVPNGPLSRVSGGDGIRVDCAPLAHGIASYGYAVTEEDRPGHLNVEALAAAGVPAGPLYGRIKNGEQVTLPDGRSIDGRDFVGPTIPGRKIVICGDSKPTANTVALARGADVLVHEATFMDEDRLLAARANHSTAADAARMAAEAGVRTLILTHLSPRYEDGENPRLPKLLAEAQAVFPNTLLASDLWTYEIPSDRA